MATTTWKDILPDFQAVRKIGSGSYSTVFEAIHTPTGQRVAIKREERIFNDLLDCKRVLREIRLLKELKHPNVVRLLDVRAPKGLIPDTIYLVLELAELDLKAVIRSPSVNLQIWQIKSMMYDILKGLKYIHTAAVLHRDIKPGNILLIDNSRMLICDFGLARSVASYKGPSEYIKKNKSPERMKELSTKSGSSMSEEEKEEYMNLEIPTMTHQLTSYVVTRWYRAPEIILCHSDYGSGIDIWAVGCILAEMLSKIKGSGKERPVLFPGTSCYPFSPVKSSKGTDGSAAYNTDQLNVIMNVMGKPLEEDCAFIKDPSLLKALKEMPDIPRKNFAETYPSATTEAVNLLDLMLCFNPYKRLTVEQCLEHPFFSDIRKPDLEVSAPGEILLPFEEEGELSQKRLTQLFMEDLAYFDELRAQGMITYK